MTLCSELCIQNTDLLSWGRHCHMHVSFVELMLVYAHWEIQGIVLKRTWGIFSLCLTFTGFFFGCTFLSLCPRSFPLPWMGRLLLSAIFQWAHSGFLAPPAPRTVHVIMLQCVLPSSSNAQIKLPYFFFLCWRCKLLSILLFLHKSWFALPYSSFL